jgi:inorganic pyrophosphatase
MLGALEIEQHETDGTVQRNDRLLAVAADSREHKHLHTLADLSPDMLHEVEHFFHSYNEAKGGEVKVLRRVGPERAHELLTQALTQA